MKERELNPAPRNPLAAAYHEAARAHAEVIQCGTALQIFTAYRTVLVAERALLRDSV